MILDSFRVTEFRSVQDSGWIDAEQITALILCFWLRVSSIIRMRYFFWMNQE